MSAKNHEKYKKSKHRFFPMFLRICLYNSHYFLHSVSHASTGPLPHQHPLQHLDEVAAYRVLDPSRTSVHEKWFVSRQTLAKCQGLVVGPSSLKFCLTRVADELGGEFV